MPRYRISVINKDFASTNAVEFSNIEDARSQAMKGALEIGSDEVAGGKPFFGAEITIEQDDMVIDRIMVSIGQTPLKLTSS